MNEAPDYPQLPNWDLVPLSITVEGGLAILAIAGGWILGLDVVQLLRLDELWGQELIVKVAVYSVLGTLPMLGLLLAVEVLPLKPLKEFREFSHQVLAPMFAEIPIGGLLVIGLMAGFGEELLFRGLLQSFASHWMPTMAAVVLVGLVFGGMHYLTATYAIIAALMGCYLGYLFAATGEIWIPILVHGIYDFVALLYLRYKNKTQPVPKEAD